MYFLGLDIGTSSIKASVVDANTQQVIASTSFPEVEVEISSLHDGWAEQDPELWWKNTQGAILKLNATKLYNPKEIAAIGISYQMHGLVMVDKQKEVLRPSIIWCDSRAVEIGEKAFDAIGENYCLPCLLNSPGNFTASKLAWVKENEPEVFEKCHKIMLPGDFIAMKLTNEITTTFTGLSEGVFWDFKENKLSEKVLDYFGFTTAIFPEIQSSFSNHGGLSLEIAENLGLTPNTPVTYKAGDQPNNALSLDVLEPGEIAATAGTSGVIYAVSDQVSYDAKSRINSFAHVNHLANDQNRIGILLCINGTGILNRWVKDNFGANLSYNEMNKLAAEVAIGSNGVVVLPFGNGAERIFENKILGSHIGNLNFNKHSRNHIFRAAQEGIACSFKYGFDIMQANGLEPKVIKAGNANMFLSDIFKQTLSNITNIPIELYDTDGAKGAALGAGYGIGYYKTLSETFNNLTKIEVIEPVAIEQNQEMYKIWLRYLQKGL